MDASTRSRRFPRPRFSVRSLLLLVFLTAVAFGFFYLYGQIRLANEILYLYGLKWEPLELADDEFRIVVQQQRVDFGTALISAQIHTDGRTEYEVWSGDYLETGVMLTKKQEPEPQPVFLNIIYDTSESGDKKFAKAIVQVCQGNTCANGSTDRWIEVPADGKFMPQLKSGVFKRGQRIPLFELNGVPYVMDVK